MAKKKALDPVTRYATDVVSGKVVAARLVRLAGQRHLADLEQAAKKELVWNPVLAQEAIDFFPEVLCLPEDTESEDDEDETADHEPKPFVLTPYQQFIVGSLFGWFQWRTGKKTRVRKLRQRFRIAYIEGAKGCGKTPLCAGILIYLLVKHGVRGAQLFCAAVTKDQAKLAFADCEKMVQASPHLRALVDQKVNNLAVLATGNFIRPISSEKRGLDGKRVKGAVIDELHEHPTGTVVQKVIAGIKGQPNALVLIPTNSGFDRETVCWYYHEYSRQVLEGTLVNESWFAFVCHLDACDACHAAGKLQPADDCPHCDDWRVEGPHWLKPNPNVGVSVSWQYVRDQVRIAIDMPSERNMVRRLNFCQWTQQATVWIPPEMWTACKSDTVSAATMAGRECYVGVDLSDKIDLSSVVCIFPRDMERAQLTEAVLAEDATDAPALDRAIDVLPYFWMPEKSLHRRGQEDGMPYPQWAEEGHIFTSHGELIDHDQIVDFIIDVVAVKYRLRGIGFDQAGATAAVTRLQRHFGDSFVTEIPQSHRMLSEPTKTVQALIVSRNLAHNGNPAMAMCVGNIAIDENRWNEIRPDKINQRKRIDGGVALIDAVKTMQVADPDGPVDDPELMVVTL